MSDTPATLGQDYARRMYALVIDWYKGADAKAQVLLTLDGVFVAFLTASTFAKPADLAPVVAEFTPATWGFLGLMSLALALSIGCALMCLRSRTASRREVEETLRGMDMDQGSSYRAEVLAYFQYFANLRAEPLADRLAGMDANLEIRALTHQIVKLSENVTQKHRDVNIGFFLAALSLWAFLAAAATYVYHVVA